MGGIPEFRMNHRDKSYAFSQYLKKKSQKPLGKNLRFFTGESSKEALRMAHDENLTFIARRILSMNSDSNSGKPL